MALGRGFEGFRGFRVQGAYGLGCRVWVFRGSFSDLAVKRTLCWDLGGRI